MKLKNIKGNVILTIMLLTLIIISGSTVYASENNVTVSLPVEQTFEVQYDVPDNLDQTGTYELTSLSQDAPMPAASKNGTYTFTMNNSNNSTVIPFTYTHGGVYQYKLLQTTKDVENYVYDRTTYTITVYIKNGEAGQLVPEIIVENGSGKKCKEINFTNIYNGKENSETQSSTSTEESLTSIKESSISTEENSSSIEENSNAIETGDKTNIGILLIIGASSILVIVLLFKKKKQS